MNFSQNHLLDRLLRNPLKRPTISQEPLLIKGFSHNIRIHQMKIFKKILRNPFRTVDQFPFALGLSIGKNYIQNNGCISINNHYKHYEQILRLSLSTAGRKLFAEHVECRKPGQTLKTTLSSVLTLLRSYERQGILDPNGFNPGNVRDKGKEIRV